MSENIDTKELERQMEKQNNADEDEVFAMSNEEVDEAKTGNFNQFWVTKDMEYDKAYLFKVVSDKMTVRNIKDKFQNDEETPRMVIAVELLETGVVYDLACNKNKNKDGKYASLTLAMRRLYALTVDNGIKDVQFKLVKSKYKHATWGDTDSFKIDIVTE